MATWTSCLAQVRRELEEATAATWADATLLALANDALKEIARRTMLLFDEQYTSTVAGTNSYVLPTLTIDIDDVRCGDRRLVQVGTASFPERARSGRPVQYAVEGGTLYLEPTPDAVYELRFFRNYLPDPLVTGDDELPFEGQHDALVRAYVKARAYEQILDWESARNFDAIYKRGLDDAQFDAANNTRGRTSPSEVY